MPILRLALVTTPPGVALSPTIGAVLDLFIQSIPTVGALWAKIAGLGLVGFAPMIFTKHFFVSNKGLPLHYHLPLLLIYHIIAHMQVNTPEKHKKT